MHNQPFLQSRTFNMMIPSRSASLTVLIVAFMVGALVPTAEGKSAKVSRLSFHETPRFLAAGEDCHCDGDEVHCEGETDESICHCDDGDVHCSGEDCHCDGDEVHCEGETNEDLCTCESDSVQCEQGASKSKDKPWGEVIITSIVVNLMTLIGVVFAAGGFLLKIFFPQWEINSETQRNWTRNFVPMFACGALLATVVFLILPEALNMITGSLKEKAAESGHRLLEDAHSSHDESEDNTEAGAAWRWGSSIMGGFLIPVVVHYFLPDHSNHAIDHYKTVDNQQENAFADNHKEHAHMAENSTDVDKDNSDDFSVEAEESTVQAKKIEGQEEEGENTDEASVEAEESTDENGKPGINWALFASLTVGDFFHNFADGIFIGTAWLQCDRDLAITIAGATIAHELPQEIADYFLFVHQCNMSPLLALVMNFVVGTSILLGGIIVLAIPDIDDGTIGVILAISSGVYMHIAICECYGRAEKHQVNKFQKAGGFLAFLVGAIPIGLVLLNHEHCGDHNH